jgi:hypothetical protein
MIELKEKESILDIVGNAIFDDNVIKNSAEEYYSRIIKREINIPGENYRDNKFHIKVGFNNKKNIFYVYDNHHTWSYTSGKRQNLSHNREQLEDLIFIVELTFSPSSKLGKEFGTSFVQNISKEHFIDGFSRILKTQIKNKIAEYQKIILENKRLDFELLQDKIVSIPDNTPIHQKAKLIFSSDYIFSDNKDILLELIEIGEKIHFQEKWTQKETLLYIQTILEYIKNIDNLNDKYFEYYIEEFSDEVLFEKLREMMQTDNQLVSDLNEILNKIIVFSNKSKENMFEKFTNKMLTLDLFKNNITDNKIYFFDHYFSKRYKKVQLKSLYFLITLSRSEIDKITEFLYSGQKLMIKKEEITSLDYLIKSFELMKTTDDKKDKLLNVFKLIKKNYVEVNS